MPVFSTKYLLGALLSAHIGLCTPVFGGPAEQALTRVQASFAALQSAQRDFRQLRAGGHLSAGAARDYESYIAQLRQQFFDACKRLSQWPGAVTGTATPCPAQVPRSVGFAAIDQAAEQSQAERTSALTRQLDAALGDFDEMLLREQEQVKAATPATTAAESRRGGSAGGGANPADSANGGEATARGTMNGEDTQGPGQAAGDTPAGPAGDSEDRPRTAARGQPPDVPDGSDDDVVARQLREAAEKETDPELRARLWEEYRKYKRGTR
jgi:hypothetical protein